MSKYDPDTTLEPDAPLYDPFEEHALQIAYAVSKREPVTNNEYDILKQYCSNQLQDKENL